MFQKLEKWAKLRLSWSGRITVIKMILLPKLLYCFRALPIKIQMKDLKIFQSKIMECVCVCALVLWYYRAECLAQFSRIYLQGEQPDWIKMEMSSLERDTIEGIIISRISRIMG